MAKTDHTTKRRSRRTRIKKVTASAPKPASASDALTALRPPAPPDPLKQAIDTERAQLMQAQAVVKTLSAALMHAEDDAAMYYVDTANVAAELIDEAVGALDRIKTGGVREPAGVYVCVEALELEDVRSLEEAPTLALPRAAGEGIEMEGIH